MAAKTARVYTLDELKEKCQKALADQKLVEIVKTAPLNKDGKVNLSWVYKEAEKYVHGETKDLQKTKELAVETRFLAMLRREDREEFDKLVSQKKQPEPSQKETEKKLFEEMEFVFNNGVELITRTSYIGGTQHSVKFTFDNSTPPQGRSDREVGRKFCMDILNALVETADPREDMIDLMNGLIQLLEEKFGLEVKVCGNCDNLTINNTDRRYEYLGCKCITTDNRKKKPDWGICNTFVTCPNGDWTPKKEN